MGIQKFNELAKSMMLGDETGMLKLLFDRNTRKLLGVHILGQRATEIVHIGQAVMAFGGTTSWWRRSRRPSRGSPTRAAPAAGGRRRRRTAAGSGPSTSIRPSWMTRSTPVR